MAAAALLASGHSPTWWWYAYETAGFIRNRIATRTAKGFMSPFQFVYNELPNWVSWRVWGCRCWVYIDPMQMRKDFREHAKEGYFISYSSVGAQGWKVFVPSENSIVVSSLVTFDESFPTRNEEYYAELKKYLEPEDLIVADPKDYKYLVGATHIDDEDHLLSYCSESWIDSRISRPC